MVNVLCRQKACPVKAALLVKHIFSPKTHAYSCVLVRFLLVGKALKGVYAVKARSCKYLWVQGKAKIRFQKRVKISTKALIIATFATKIQLAVYGRDA